MVKRFQSRYEQIHRIREQQEETAKRLLAARNADLTAATEMEQRQREKLQEVLQNAGSQMLFGVSGSFLGSLQQEISFHEKTLAECSTARHRAELQAQLAAATLKTATVNRKTVDELISRERTLYRADMLKQEDIRLQEQASQAWQRRRVDTSNEHRLTTTAVSKPDHDEQCILSTGADAERKTERSVS